MYNGWKNRATWNVALWINNDPDLYSMATEWLASRKAAHLPINYTAFIRGVDLWHDRTPDGYSFDSRMVCRKELTSMLRDMITEGEYLPF